MCIALPARVVQVDPLGATVEADGRRRRASTLLVPDVGVGDWVVVATGTIVRRLDDSEALDIIAALQPALPAEESVS